MADIDKLIGRLEATATDWEKHGYDEAKTCREAAQALRELRDENADLTVEVVSLRDVLRFAYEPGCDCEACYEIQKAITAIGDEKCRKCGGKMIDGVALMPAYAGAPDFPGDTGQERGCTISQVPSTDANLEGVRKCRECGWSVTGAAIGDDNNSPTEK